MSFHRPEQYLRARGQRTQSLYGTMPPNTKNNDTKRHPLPVTWGSLTDKNVKQLQRLNSTIFPVKYNNRFYSEAIKAPEGFVKLAYYNEFLVGAVCCRKENYASNKAIGKAVPQSSSNSHNAGDASSQSSLYIMTLGVLAPYRERGIGKQLITHVLHLVRTSPACADVVDVYLHVQEGNDEALRFYEGYGFEVKEKLVGYYKRIEPSDCYIVRKPVERR